MKTKTVSLRMTERDFNFLEGGVSPRESRTDFIIRSVKTARALEVLQEIYKGQRVIEALIYLELGNFEDFMNASFTIEDINLLRLLDRLCLETFSDEQMKAYRDSIKFRKGIVL